VKNNLQTVAALLRLQSRRLEDPAARAALAEAGRRLSTVALVHDTLSHALTEQVNFDEVANRILRATVEVASTRTVVATELRGTFGRLLAEDATHLAMILAELVHNAVEHGFEEGPPHEVAPDDVPRVVVDAQRHRTGAQERLEVTVADNGAGMPDGAAGPDRSGLGVQIVEALISDLRGRIGWETRKPHGTAVRFTVRLRSSA
jgi:two-component sensor histidine kinase